MLLRSLSVFPSVALACPRYPLLSPPDSTCASRSSAGSFFATENIMPEPIRYRQIRISKEDNEERLYSLVQDYLRDPELASSVTQISLRYPVNRDSYGCFYNEDGLVQVKAEESVREVSTDPALVEAVKGLDVGDKMNDWLRTLTWMSPDLVAARSEREKDWRAPSWYPRQRAIFSNCAAVILLTLCPNIERIILEEDYYTTSIFEGVLLKNNHGLLPQKHLQKLKHVKFLPMTDMILGDERYHVSMSYMRLLRMFNRLPLLEDVSVDAITEDNNGPELLPPHTSNIKTLHIGHTDMSSMNLGSIIRVPKALESFTFSIGGRSTTHGGRCIVDLKTLGKALLCHKASLHTLDLDCDDYIHGSLALANHADEVGGAYEILEQYMDDVRDRWFALDEKEGSGPLFVRDLANTREYGKTMGSLDDFSALRHIRIGVKVLLGPDDKPAPFRLFEALPRNLESLLLRGYKKGKNREHDGQIDEFLRHVGEFPLLKNINGIEETVPSAWTVRNPDVDEDQLWTPEEENDGWMEV